jgi:hypothetical protein
VKPTPPSAENVDLNGVATKWLDLFGKNQAAAISLIKPLHTVISAAVAKKCAEYAAIAASTAAASASTATSVSLSATPVGHRWLLPEPLLLTSNFALPAMFTSQYLETAFVPFSSAAASGAAAMSSSTLSSNAASAAPTPFPKGSCSLKFESVLSASHRRLLFNVSVLQSKERLVLKFAKVTESAKRERERIERVVNLFSDALKAHQDRVRLPIGFVDVYNPIIVSRWWPGRSLNGVGLNVEDCEKVCAILEQQIWPVLDAMANQGYFYLDLWAGNVMVDDSLESAWLIDFEGVVTDKVEGGSPIDVQKSALLNRVKENKLFYE